MVMLVMVMLVMLTMVKLAIVNMKSNDLSVAVGQQYTSRRVVAMFIISPTVKREILKYISTSVKDMKEHLLL